MITKFSNDLSLKAIEYPSKYHYAHITVHDIKEVGGAKASLCGVLSLSYAEVKD
jgi:hypothetical protein